MRRNPAEASAAFGPPRKTFHDKLARHGLRAETFRDWPQFCADFRTTRPGIFGIPHRTALAARRNPAKRL
jgi:hypothetical protein